jgi:hypothetical protein
VKPFKPHRYQGRGIKFGVERACFGLFWDPGLGKTSTIYAIFKILKKLGYIKRMLVIAEKAVAYEVWPEEQKEWEDFKDIRVVVLHGKDKDELLLEKHDVAVVNPEGLPWLLGYMTEKGKRVPGAAQKAGVWWDFLCVDESPLFKHMQTERFKMLRPHIPKFKRRCILTGDPAPNGLLDLFGQIYILDTGNALGGYITQFRREYFFPTGYEGKKWIIRKGAEKRIYKKLAPLILRMDAADYMPLPPYIENPVRITLPAKARKIYDEMEALLIAEVDSNLVTAANVAVATQKCRQISNGGVYQDDKRISQIHDAKTEAAQRIVEELGGKPCLIAYEFRHDLLRLKKAFPDAPAINADTTREQFASIKALWNAGETPVLLIQQSKRHGLNLQKSGCVAIIWYGLTWNLDFYRQLIRRVWRQGYKKRLVVHLLIARDTIDEAMVRSIRAKDKTQKALLDALKAYTKKRYAA